ncbi:MAG: glutamate--tRNA ligase [Patescibacteria group bacterium]|jgi:glutamyl-tRNA synthetase
MSEQIKYRTRVAPSPTGDPHVGLLRNALYNYFLARQSGGQFILRIEDTDQAREVEGSIDRILAALNWIGTVPDEGPFKQSDYKDEYLKLAKELINKGHAYYCFCSSERLDQLRAEQAKNHQAPRYDRKCRELDKAESEKRSLTEPHVIRMKMPDDEEIVLRDAVKGEVKFNSNEIDDQVIIKSDGFPTYHLASVVDDHLMKINLMLRSDEWLSSSPKHLMLYRYFGWDLPTFAHLPLILNLDRTKISKRKNDTSVLSYKAKGYHPLAMAHFLMFCGWNPEKTQDTYSFADYEKLFSLDRVGKSPAVFDIKKLDWLSHQYFNQDKIDDVFAAYLVWLGDKAENTEVEELFIKLARENHSAAQAMLDIVRMRADYFTQYSATAATFFNQDKLGQLSAVDLLQDGKIDKVEAIKALELVKQSISKIEKSWYDEKSAEKRSKQLNEYFRQVQPAELSPAAYLHPTRVAITGEKQSMNMFEYLSVYLLMDKGVAEIEHRLDHAAAILKNENN